VLGLERGYLQILPWTSSMLPHFVIPHSNQAVHPTVELKITAGTTEAETPLRQQQNIHLAKN
jgi:hypothetical protein